MEFALAIGFGSFFVASSVVGIRLLMLSRRTGQLPELLIGIGVLGIGPLGFGLSMIARFPGQSMILAAVLTGCSFLALFIGAASQYLFAWYVFRLRDAWARPLCFAAVVLLAATYTGDILENGLVNPIRGGTWFWMGMTLRLGVLLWNATESFAYWARMRRRLRLGLADPVVTNRFLLWGLGSGAAFVGSAVGGIAIVLTGFSAGSRPLVAFILSMHGFIAAVAMWLAFMPPQRYRRWIERRSQRSSVAVSSDSR
jgi:hypothetical protein